ncbi:hexose kinase [Klebsiella variicola]|uniref:hexose kinase n=1 Tax=Klebsiella variicola TaxID=244366 RepID=UPI00182FB6D6|nr:hexose kinase [Klebsiella variicola]EAV1661744.1 tagatose-6-phosphate kinase [Salmonella enterica]EFE1488248.1 hexose kinase [Escherichia coli]HDK8413715.1 hexose kinase [Klebsiella pneumoniae]EEL9623353.1 hexose kinase [Salmonella enterica]ELW6259103.1 hexose kinase [Escherichia coli]
MILTVTMNPSVDISYALENLKINTVNRVSDVRKEAGGKGLNVSRVLKQADEDVLATGLVGGVLGTYIREHLDTLNIRHHFQPISMESRNCIAILHEGFQTEILESGPVVSASEQDNFLNLYSRLLDKADIVIISGSLPVGIPKYFYHELVTLSQRKNKKVLLDCTGICLSSALSGSAVPYLIKPNKEEFEKLTGESLEIYSVKSFINIVNTDEKLRTIPWIVVSLGKDGAFAKVNDEYFRVTVPEIRAVNPVGSGDSTIAGLAIGLKNHEPAEAILKRAMTFGMLNAIEPQTGFIDLSKYDELVDHVTLYREM